MKDISIGSWAYTIGPYASNPIPWDEVIVTLRSLGFQGVELGGFPPHPNPDDMPSKGQRDECKARLAEVGLRFSGLAANLWGEHLIDTDDQTPYIECFRKNLDFCVDLGIKGIRVDTVQGPTIFDQVDPSTARSRVVTTWRRCSREAADKGVYVTWEFEPGFAFNKPSDILRIVDEVGDDNFGVQFDTCHAHMVAAVGARQPGQPETLPGGALELAQKLRGKINHIHLIDSDGTLHDDETSTHAPFGEGVLDFDALLPELNKNPMPHNWWTIDLCFWPDAWEVTERSKAAVDVP
ncbi:MAG: sugar phosphate isomerase/epimerase [Armatimonadetes bacterium]|nr:sugar phosphate isomerase/epimerase [Armatimonadota bacterium]